MNIAAYSLFGHSKSYDRTTYYCQFLAGVVRAHHNLFPGWELWIHHDTENTARLQGYARENLVKLVDCGRVVQPCIAMLWRMKPVWEPDVRYALCRDIDSLPMPKDRRMVEAFVQSGLAAHSEGDNPSHTAHFMGGMCGFLAPELRALTGLNSWDEFMAASKVNMAAATGGADQEHLYSVLWNKLAAHTLHHRINGIPGTATPLLNLHRSVPDLRPAGVPDYILAHGDSLASFLGSSGFDVAEAVKFYDTHGCPGVAERARKAETC